MNVVVEEREQRQIGIAESDLIFAGEKACIRLENKVEAGDTLSTGKRNVSSIWAHIFDVNVEGKISHLDGKNSPRGIELLPGTAHVYGKTRGQVLGGASFNWPKGIAYQEEIEETIVVILTDRAVNLHCLAQPGRGIHRGTAASTLERLASQIATGGARDCTDPVQDVTMNFDIIHISFRLAPPVVSGSDLKDADDEATSSRSKVCPPKIRRRPR
jgi:hypothetical protein